LIGFSFGAPQVLIAAAHQDVSDQLAGVVGFGGYCDVASMVRFQMTGRFASGFEPPESPDITVALDEVRIDKAVAIILEALKERGQFET
jgi:hypothetical protein